MILGPDNRFNIPEDSYSLPASVISSEASKFKSEIGYKIQQPHEFWQRLRNGTFGRVVIGESQRFQGIESKISLVSSLTYEPRGLLRSYLLRIDNLGIDPMRKIPDLKRLESDLRGSIDNISRIFPKDTTISSSVVRQRRDNIGWTLKNQEENGSWVSGDSHAFLFYAGKNMPNSETSQEEFISLLQAGLEMYRIALSNSYQQNGLRVPTCVLIIAPPKSS